MILTFIFWTRRRWFLSRLWGGSILHICFLMQKALHVKGAARALGFRCARPCLLAFKPRLELEGLPRTSVFPGEVLLKPLHVQSEVSL